VPAGEVSPPFPPAVAFASARRVQRTAGEEYTMPSTIDDAVVGIARAKGFVGARLRGLRGVFTTLSEQHHEVDVLLARARAATEPDERRLLWAGARRELVSHERAEFIEIYAPLERRESTRCLALEHAGDADELETRILAIDRVGFHSNDWARSVEALRAKLAEHEKLEERRLFPAIQDALGENAARALDSEFLRTYDLTRSALG
jgi:hypothetical protein